MTRPSGIHGSRIAVIHVARGKLGMSESAYRELLYRVAGVSSSNELTNRGFRDVMNEFARLGFESSAREAWKGELASPRTHASYAQRRLMQSLWDQWKGRSDADGLRRWLSRHFHVSHLRFCSAQMAPKVISALRAFQRKE